RQPNLRRLLFEHGRNFHAEFYIFDTAADHIRDHAWPFFEIDPGDDIGDIGFKGLRCRAADHLTDDCKGIDFTLAAHRRPLDALATALEARRPWRPDPSATILATLHDKFLLRRGVPEGLASVVIAGSGLRRFTSAIDDYASFPRTATAQQPRFLP